jgi:phospholipid:diacylglycerol acyltransferase
MYGVSKDTERKYQYAMSASNLNASSLTGKHYEDGNIPLSLNTTANDPNINLANGIYFKDGDGSVPLLSLGLVCAHGWRQPYLNPASIPIVTREYKHQPVSMIADVRGGPLSSDHVDILGNEQMLMDVIEIVSQKTVNDNNPESWPSPKSRFYSDILNWKLPPGWI